MSLKNREKIYYEDQTNRSLRNYNSLYFILILNKAILNEQEFLGKINCNLLANSTKAIIKALVDYYGKYEIYEIFLTYRTYNTKNP